MINLIEGERLLCNACYVDLQDENLGDFDSSPWHHRSIPWHADAVCCCCHATYRDRSSFRITVPMEGMDLASFYGSARHPLFATKAP